MNLFRNIPPLFKPVFLSGIFIFFTIQLHAQFYNGTQIDFGKNRVQYDEFEWKYYHFEDFSTYFYTGGENLAEYTGRYATKELKDIEEALDYSLDDRVQFIVYNKQSHFRQSNVGLGIEERYNIGGVTDIVGSKVFIYFEGDYEKFNEQIRDGIAQVIINQLMYGGNWRDVLKNATLLNLPEWYVQGLVEYISTDWDNSIENKVRDGISTGKFNKFNRLEGEEAIVAGHAMWHYIAETYGESVIPNILYMTKINRNIESGFLYVLGVSMNSLTKEWIGYYKDKYAIKERMASTPESGKLPIKIKKNTSYRELKVSPDENYISYVTNKFGKKKIWLYDVENDKRKKIYRKGHKLDRIIDYSYPVMDWHPSGQLLSFVVEDEGEVLLKTYDLETKGISTKPFFNLEKVLSLDYSDDGKQLVVSGVHKGQSDIYIYNIAAKTLKKITDDVYDDHNPVFLRNSTRIAFASNRQSDTLEGANEIENKPFNTEKDIFVYQLNDGDEVLYSVTNTPEYSESQPAETKDGLQYLREFNGVINRFEAYFDSTIAYVDTAVHYRFFYKNTPITNYTRNIQEFDISPKTGRLSEIVYLNGEYQMFYRKSIGSPGYSQIRDKGIQDEGSQPDDETEKNFKVVKKQLQHIPIEEDTASSEVDISDYRFEDEQKETVVKKQVVTIGEEKDESVKEDGQTEEDFKIPEQRNYYMSFASDNSITQLNNSFINQQYQVFNGGPYINPGLGAVMKMGIKDLFEDQRIYGGLRLAGGSKEYFIGYQDFTDRLDKELILSRTELRQANDFRVIDINTNTFSYSLKWPFSEVSSIRGVASMRNDKFIAKSTDFNTLQLESLNEFWGVMKGAYVFDNTRNPALNIHYGTKFKVFGELYRQIGDENSNIKVVGMDLRHYQKIHRELIWVNRLAGSTSFGKEKVVFYMGSVDDWMILGSQERFNRETNIDYSQNYRYQALASNMRGFNQNIRNGNTFAVFNSELRWPVFNYFIHKPIKSEFLENFQIVGFGDVGTAWTGLSPYSDDNSLNTDEIERGPVKVTLYNRYEPIVGGYGFGFRSKLLGYFVRTDWAWGVLDGVVQKPIFYLSLSLDI